MSNYEIVNLICSVICVACAIINIFICLKAKNYYKKCMNLYNQSMNSNNIVDKRLVIGNNNSHMIIDN